jgi:hypothetical protein
MEECENKARILICKQIGEYLKSQQNINNQDDMKKRKRAKMLKSTNKTYTITKLKTVDSKTKLRMQEQETQNNETAKISQHSITTKKKVARNKKEIEARDRNTSIQHSDGIVSHYGDRV